MALLPAGAALAEDCGTSQHPSGKDRCVEEGGSGTQGDAKSDPDDDGRGPERTNGGADEPGGPGGENLDDQDGNNGCGNDQDFEDDNEGLCGGNGEAGSGPNIPRTDDKDKDKDKGNRPDEAAGPHDGGKNVAPGPGTTSVMDDKIRPRAGIGEAVQDSRGPSSGVAATGAAIDRAAAALAATGLGSVALGVAALLLISLGAVLMRRSRITR